jgi:hypothetical protein
LRRNKVARLPYLFLFLVEENHQSRFPFHHREDHRAEHHHHLRPPMEKRRDEERALIPVEQVLLQLS